MLGLYLDEYRIKFGSVSDENCYSNLVEESGRQDVSWPPIILQGVPKKMVPRFEMNFFYINRPLAEL